MSKKAVSMTAAGDTDYLALSILDSMGYELFQEQRKTEPSEIAVRFDDDVCLGDEWQLREGEDNIDATIENVLLRTKGADGTIG